MGKGALHQDSRLKQMAVEELLGFGDKPDQYEKQVWLPEIYTKWENSREKLGQYMTTKKANTCEEMQGLAKATSAKLWIVDDTWKVEQSVLQELSGDASITRTHQVVIAMFPTPEKIATAADVLNLVSAFSIRTGMKYAPRQVWKAFRLWLVG